jgi:hypothetical protein
MGCTGQEGVGDSNPPRAQRKLAGSVVARDHGICHICGWPGADTAHHLT